MSGNGADPSSYEEAISQLTSIAQQLEEDVAVLQRAAEDCVDNMPEDPAAETSSGRVNECAAQINTGIEKIQEVIRALQEELSDIEEAASRANG